MDIKLKIRWAVREDMDKLLKMIQDLAIEEQMPAGPEITKEILEYDCFDSEPPLYKCYVVEWVDSKGITIIGYAIFFFIFSTWSGKALMLEDIYVQPEYRHKGVGKKIFSTLSQFAVDNSCQHIDFNVLNWNKARAFYKAIGSINLSDLIGYTRLRFTKSDIDRFK